MLEGKPRSGGPGFPCSLSAGLLSRETRQGHRGPGPLHGRPPPQGRGRCPDPAEPRAFPLPLGFTAASSSASANPATFFHPPASQCQGSRLPPDRTRPLSWGWASDQPASRPWASVMSGAGLPVGFVKGLT